MAKRRKKRTPTPAQLAYYARNKVGTVVHTEERPTKQHYKLALLNEREKTHGDFAINARAAQDIKSVYVRCVTGNPLMDIQKEALDMIASKIGRILAGDANTTEHWRDLAGYATLVAERLERDAASANNAVS